MIVLGKEPNLYITRYNENKKQFNKILIHTKDHEMVEYSSCKGGLYYHVQ